MKTKKEFILGLLVIAACLSACKRNDSQEHASETAVVGPEFSAQKGLRVPDDTRQSLGLEIVEVAETHMPNTIKFEGRVYKLERATAFLSATVSSAEAKQLQAGQVVKIQVTSDKSVGGKITEVKRGMEKATGLIEVLTEIPNAEGIAVGAFVQGSVSIASQEDAVTIPRTALLECSDGFSVYTMSGEHFVRTPVKIGASTGDRVEIKDGLYAGDEVVLKPVMSLWMTELAAVKGGQACCAMPSAKK